MRQLTQITIGDDPAAWTAAGFATANGALRIGEVDVRLVGAAGRRAVLGWDLGGHDVDGLRYVAEPIVGDVPSVHPNGASLIDHVVVASPDLDRTAAAFAAAGFPTRRERVAENYGTPMRQCFAKSGAVVLELVGGTTPAADDAVRARPAGFFGLALNVRDLDALAEQLGDGLGRIKDAVQPGRRIATLRHEQFGISVPVAFMTE